LKRFIESVITNIRPSNTIIECFSLETKAYRDTIKIITVVQMNTSNKIQGM